MRVVLVLCSIVYILFACSGDCLLCHPGLKKEIDKPPHDLLKKCIECHKDTGQMGGACGGDCFQCHDKRKVMNDKTIVSHSKLSECKTCHFKEDEIFNFKPLQKGNFLMDEILNPS